MTHRSSRSRLGVLFTAVLALASCGDDATGPEFDESLDIDLSAMVRTASGLYYLDIEVGEGDPAQGGDRVEVGYAGWLSDGRMFDSGTFPFTLGTGAAIAGFDEGVTGMRVDGLRRLVIPPELAYGDRGQGPIPGGATLVFEVRLLAIQ